MSLTQSRRRKPATDLDLAEVLGALGDPVRLAMIRALDTHEALACGEFGDTESTLRLPPPTLTRHLNVLRGAGIISTAAEGTRRINSLDREALDARFPGLLTSVLAGAAMRKRSARRTASPTATRAKR